MKSCSRFLAPLLALALPAAAAAQSTTQNFRYEAPGDVRPGPITMEGQALIGAVDHSWIKFKVESEWGWFSYRLTRLDAEPGSLPAAEAPNRPAAARTSRDLSWPGIDLDGPPPQFWLDGEITAVHRGGAELEGRFGFQGEIVRLRLELLDNVMAGTNPPPTLRHVAYGPDPEQTLDFYRARSSGPTPVAVYIHGGGWRRGDKSELNEVFHFHELLDAGIAVASINYRFCPPANPAPAVPAVFVPLHDAAQAIQFIRSRAREWGLDKARLGLWGTSAGADSTLWLATHPDMADPASADPLARESTRPLCAVAIVPQTSLDPRQMRAWVGPQLDFGAYAFGIGPANDRKASFAHFLAARERLRPWIEAYSPAALLTREGPPLFIDYRDLGLVPHRPLADYYTHSPRFGIGFYALAQRLGHECYLRYAGLDATRYGTWQNFLIAKLLGGSGEAGPGRPGH